MRATDSAARRLSSSCGTRHQEQVQHEQLDGMQCNVRRLQLQAASKHYSCRSMALRASQVMRLTAFRDDAPLGKRRECLCDPASLVEPTARQNSDLQAVPADRALRRLSAMRQPSKLCPVRRRPAAAAARLASHCSAPWPPLCHTPAPLWCCKWFQARKHIRCVKLAAVCVGSVCHLSSACRTSPTLWTCICCSDNSFRKLHRPILSFLACFVDDTIGLQPRLVCNHNPVCTAASAWKRACNEAGKRSVEVSTPNLQHCRTPHQPSGAWWTPLQSEEHPKAAAAVGT